MNSRAPTVPAINLTELAKRCRKAILLKYPRVNSCVESTYLFEQTTHLLGLETKRVVCQLAAYTPLLAEALARQDDVTQLLGRPGYWSVAVGIMQYPGDYVGFMDVAKNRYVGHIICHVEGQFVDLSIDQVSRPEKGLTIVSPVVFEANSIPPESHTLEGVASNGIVLRYRIHESVIPPAPLSKKILDRMARAIVTDLQNTRSHTKLAPRLK